MELPRETLEEIDRKVEEYRTVLMRVAMLDLEPARDATLSRTLGSCLSPRAVNVLASCGCHTIGDLIQLAERDLMEIPNFGQRSLTEIKLYLRSIGMRLSAGPGKGFGWWRIAQENNAASCLRR